MRAIKQAEGYYLYKSTEGNLLELWKGRQGTEWAFRAGYVTDRENFEIAVENAKEEMRYLMAQD